MRRALVVAEPHSRSAVARPGHPGSLPAPAAAGPGAAPPSPMVYGLRKTLVEARIWARITRLALQTYGTVRAAAVVAQMVRKRSALHRRRILKFARAGGRYFWNLHGPGWPSPAFDRFIQNELDRVRPFRGQPEALQAAVLAVTKRCAYQCEHCCEWDVLNAPESLSPVDLRTIVQRLTDRGISQLFLSGGEPLRRFEELLRVIEQAAGTADVWILTSGQGLTCSRAARLRAAGLTGVALSLDHWDADAHDRFRGVPGAFHSVESGAKSAHEAGVLVALSLCPTRQFVSVENLERYALTARRLGAGFIQIFEPRSLGRYAETDAALDPDQQRTLEMFCQRLNTHASCRDMPAAAYPAAFNRQLGCAGAGDRYLYVDTDGALHACPFCRGRAGSMLDEDYAQEISKLRAAGCPAGKCCSHHSSSRQRDC